VVNGLQRIEDSAYNDNWSLEQGCRVQEAVLKARVSKLILWIAKSSEVPSHRAITTHLLLT
jgi:hypothetical protein